MLTTAAARVGDKKVKRRKRGRKTSELNHNQTPDKDEDISTDRIPTDIPPIILSNPRIYRRPLV